MANYLDLKALDKWVPLPFVSKQSNYQPEQALFVRSSCNEIWLFTGQPTIYIFNLETETWTTTKTTFSKYHPPPQRKWPWRQYLKDHTLALHTDPESETEKLYVFGGTTDEKYLGNNIFAVPDLRTLTWDYLGGTPWPKSVDDMPNLRVFPVRWIDTTQKRFYILSGSLQRMGHETYGGVNDHACDDFWSFGLETRKWRR